MSTFDLNFALKINKKSSSIKISLKLGGADFSAYSPWASPTSIGGSGAVPPPASASASGYGQLQGYGKSFSL